MKTKEMLIEISRLTEASTNVIAKVVEQGSNQEHIQKILECVLRIRNGKKLPKTLPPRDVVEAYLNLCRVVVKFR